MLTCWSLDQKRMATTKVALRQPRMILKAVFEIATPQDKVTLKKDYVGLAFEHTSQDPKTFVLSLDEIRGRLKKAYQVDTPLVTSLRGCD